MKVAGTDTRTIRLSEDGWSVEVIDQTALPHSFRTVRLRTLADAARAIADMVVRGAPLIGATAAYGMALAMREDPGDASLARAARTLLATRPTAVNLRWVVESCASLLGAESPRERAARAYMEAARICDEDVAINRAIARHGLEVLRAQPRRSGERLNVLTHCNAGWLATVDWGTALAPVYLAHDSGMAVHVWVDETRPRNQGAGLTAWELAQHGVPHTVIADNTGGHLMQRDRVDLCITGTDRTTAAGDVCNKIGTYLKALAAHDNGVPFYVALPGPSIDWRIRDGAVEIPIEERDAAEVSEVTGRTRSGEIVAVRVTPEQSPALNYAFDVTPARLVSGLITERGVCPASAEGLLALYPERRAATSAA
ncbi:MAG: S-methyl-5-thioribose-1-phosphate isomerase [Gammaproteobacteria bacterium]|nr:S-methyl-5-thioribose-1-phosphate isomerase [Gammaproteobacteria bacterium]